MNQWQQGALLSVDIDSLSHTGAGIARYEGKVIFVNDTVVGDRLLVRLLHVKSNYAHGKIHELLTPSPHRIHPRCIVADKCGGCQWQHIADDYQSYYKHLLVRENLQRIGGIASPNVKPTLTNNRPLGYRNKATYPLGMSATGQVQAGYYRKGTHQLVNLNQCPVQDERLNPLLKEIKQDIAAKGWQVYDEKKHKGSLRHLALRIGERTGEMLLTLITTDEDLPGIEAQAAIWQSHYPQLMGIFLNYNSSRTNVIFGNTTRLISGRDYLREIFASLEFHLRPDTFFQINTEAAEMLFHVILEYLQLQGNELIVDAYCGIGTFSLPLAKKVSKVIGIEVHQASVTQAYHNAQINGITNAEFVVGGVEDILPNLPIPDIVVLDPPRQGCAPRVLEALLKQQPARIVYVSCDSATLARDIQVLCQDNQYQLKMLQPVDFFPQTSHIECVAFLER